MAASKLKGKDLRKIGYPEDRVIGIALGVMEAFYKGKSKNAKLGLLKRVFENPALYLKHDSLSVISEELIPDKEQPKKDQNTYDLVDKKPYKIYGEGEIEQGAREQMETAMRLPITRSGALMPDAHQGYGLPIGGVLATENSVIPYGVGMDIGCRMCLSIYDIKPGFIQQERDNFKKYLLENTRFGHEAFKKPEDHPVLERNEFREIRIVKSLKDRAYKQIGTSGGGNHFVEFGLVEILDENNEFNLPAGKYMSLLSHSGSRGLGAEIARHYTKAAMEKCKLPGNARHLAWLNLDEEEGQEYWQAMTLAGAYASACHHQIHDRMAASLGEKPVVMIENHHNFAWKEKDRDGKELVVHRKGATPAEKNVLGVIPGSMTLPGFIVRGKGNRESLNSSAHGAGRVMSRTKAKKTLSKKEVLKQLKKAGVDVIGSGLDEAPMVYKNIHRVMDYQKDLIDIVGSFTPKVVRMCGDKKYMEVD